MAIIAKKENKEFTLTPEGVHIAVCFGVIDLGDQYDKKYKKMKRKCALQWELMDTSEDPEGYNHTISKTYNLSLHEKAILRRDLEAWRGKKFGDDESLEGFDLKNILGKACQIQIVHTEKEGKTHSNIAAIMSLPKGMVTPSATKPDLYFDMSEETDKDILDALMDNLPEWIQAMIRESETYLCPNPEETDIPAL